MVVADRTLSATESSRRIVSGSTQLDFFCLLLGLTGATVALLCGYSGWLREFPGMLYGLLLSGLVVLNIAPLLLERAIGRLDPLEPKHLFLAYFFLIFTLHSICRIGFSIGTNPELLAPVSDIQIQVRALSAILLGLAAFLIGCYLPLGPLIGKLVPVIGSIPRRRLFSIAGAGIAAGLFSFGTLMVLSGGIRTFLENLGTWRTLGVLGGVGYLTFPISVVMPGSVLLLVIQKFLKNHGRLSAGSWGVLVFYLGCLVPVLLLGFRGALMPAVLQLVAAWHYAHRRIRLRRFVVLGVLMLSLLTLFGLVRESADAGIDWKSGLASVVLRVPGLDTVERVLWRQEAGEPHRGISASLVEAGTILVPRAIWPEKPEPASLAFADIFFYDFFLGRGDPIMAVKSGVSPTIVGELLWLGGIQALILGSMILGVAATAINTWRQRQPHHPLHIAVTSIFLGTFAMFVEAPQNTLNTFMMLFFFCTGLVLAGICLTRRWFVFR